MPDLTLQISEPDSRTLATVAFILESLGITADVQATSSESGRPRLVYGGDSPARSTDITIVRRPADVIWPALLDGHLSEVRQEGVIPFDLVAAVGALLGDRVGHAGGEGALDGHDRLTYRASAAALAGYGDRPIVNAYVEYLGRVLRDRLGLVGRARWPAGRVAAIGLSHDVDSPDRYAFLQSVIRPWRLRRHPRSYAQRGADLVRERIHDRSPHDFWQFDNVADSEADLGFRSTFFFATVPFHDRWGAPYDVAYDIRAPAFRRTTRSLVERGFEVGLHASYRAHESASRLASERTRLGDVSGSEIAGLRHHYWHLGPDTARTLRFHEQAGFRYDSSLAFNDHIGFRRSVALPFHPFDETLDRPLRTVQLPTFCMDGNLFYFSTDVDAAVAAVDGLVDRIVEVGGMGSIDWHIQSSFPANREFRDWGIAYQAILRRLASRTDLWVTDLGSIASWAERRRAEGGWGSLAIPGSAQSVVLPA